MDGWIVRCEDKYIRETEGAVGGNRGIVCMYDMYASFELIFIFSFLLKS